MPFLSPTASVRPIRCNPLVPMMLRVRPAQLTTTVVSGSSSLVMSVMRRANSPPGTLRPPGMQKRRYSSGVRVSRITSFLPSSIHWCSSVASISLTWWTTSMRSPKSLEGTLLPHSVGWFWLTQRLMPPAKTDTWLYPMASTV